jgi:hypothetical protein
MKRWFAPFLLALALLAPAANGAEKSAKTRQYYTIELEPVFITSSQPGSGQAELEQEIGERVLFEAGKRGQRVAKADLAALARRAAMALAKTGTTTGKTIACVNKRSLCVELRW